MSEWRSMMNQKGKDYICWVIFFLSLKILRLQFWTCLHKPWGKLTRGSWFSIVPADIWRHFFHSSSPVHQIPSISPIYFEALIVWWAPLFLCLRSISLKPGAQCADARSQGASAKRQRLWLEATFSVQKVDNVGQINVGLERGIIPNWPNYWGQPMAIFYPN